MVALQRLRQEGQEFEVRLATQWDPIWKKKKLIKEQKIDTAFYEK